MENAGRQILAQQQIRIPKESGVAAHCAATPFILTAASLGQLAHVLQPVRPSVILDYHFVRVQPAATTKKY
jgi:hypothetical protein